MIAARKSTSVIIYILLAVSAAVGAPAQGLEASRTFSSLEAHILEALVCCISGGSQSQYSSEFYASHRQLLNHTHRHPPPASNKKSKRKSPKLSPSNADAPAPAPAPVSGPAQAPAPAFGPFKVVFPPASASSPPPGVGGSNNGSIAGSPPPDPPPPIALSPPPLAPPPAPPALPPPPLPLTPPPSPPAASPPAVVINPVEAPHNGTATDNAATATSSKSPSSGAVASAIIASILLCLLLVCGGIWFVKKRRHLRRVAACSLPVKELWTPRTAALARIPVRRTRSADDTPRHFGEFQKRHIPGSPVTRHNSLQSYPSYIPSEQLGTFDQRFLFGTDAFGAALGRKGTGGSGASSSGRSIEQFPMGTKLSVQLDARSDRWLARLAQAARRLRRAGSPTSQSPASAVTVDFPSDRSAGSSGLASRHSLNRNVGPFASANSELLREGVWRALSQPLEHSVSSVNMACHDIDFEKEIELEERIGVGAFGSVYRGRWQGAPVAIKIMQTLGSVGVDDIVESFLHEVKVLSGLVHERIICLLGACTVPPYLAIIEELAEQSLFAFLHRMPDGSERTVPVPMAYTKLLQVAIDVADALDYLHPAVVHRDLKSQNVLLDSEGRAKVCDFGIARFKDRTYISTRNNQAGTPAYMAPEMFEGERITESVDIYSFGILLWECYTGRQPWSHLATPMQVIYVVGVLKERPVIPSACPPPLARLMHSCWQQDAAARPSFADILQVLKVEQERLALQRPSQRQLSVQLRWTTIHSE